MSRRRSEETQTTIHTPIHKIPSLYKTPEPDEEGQVCFIAAARIAAAPTGWAVQRAVGVDVPFKYNLGHLLFTLCCPRQYLTVTHLPLPLHWREHRDGANAGEKEPRQSDEDINVKDRFLLLCLKDGTCKKMRTSEGRRSQGKTKDDYQVICFLLWKLNFSY